MQGGQHIVQHLFPVVFLLLRSEIYLLPSPSCARVCSGHWKLRHTPVLFVVGQVVLLAQLGLFTFVRANAEQLHRSFGFQPGVAPVFISFMLFQTIIAPVDEVCAGAGCAHQ